MSRGSKVFRPTDLPESNSSGYPAPFRDGQRKRWNRRLGDHGGLKNYGVNFVRVEPGGQSSARHSHTKQDEFVYIIEGEFVLVTDAARETVGPGTCIAFPAGTGDGHHFLNSTDKDAAFSGRGRPHARRRSHLSGHRLGVESRSRWSKDVSS